MKIKYVLGIPLAAASLLFTGCGGGINEIDFDNYQPAEEFIPAHLALTHKCDTVREYDIEETIRAMTGLELAQSQSEDFYSFLEYIAKQDYSQVAEDVLEAKARLLPILQRMFELQNQYDNLTPMWMVVRSIGYGTETLIKETDTKTIAQLSMTIADGGLGLNELLSDESFTASIDKAKLAAFDEFEKQKEVKSLLTREIKYLKTAYIDYLTEYAPIYFKYMREFDALCLKKDKAYLDAYSGRMVDAYDTSSDILYHYPRNREALLLKSLALINIGAGEYEEDGLTLPTSNNEMNLPDLPNTGMNEFYKEADVTLDYYMDLYPERSAPALLLKGLLSRRLGKDKQAISYFDQSAMEYPRQAACLMDMLDSYRNRTYLYYTPEGQYLLQLYRSTMEGYGMFSPNFMKAKYYMDLGMLDKSKEEIFNHFFRRGNQGIYDCLLSDMQFCEENLYPSFKQFMPEQYFVDVSIEPKSKKNKDEVRVSINNRSDIDLENVRIFLCLHYTDMYKDDYDVVKVPAKNIIRHHETVDMGLVNLNKEDKNYDEITRFRAIGMTDDRIFWVDNAEYKQAHASGNALSISNVTEKFNKRKELFLNAFGLDVASLENNLLNNIFINHEISGKWKKESDILNVELPRILTLLDPVFSINQIQDKDKVILPREKSLAGSVIRLSFDFNPKDGEEFPLYIYSDFVNFKVNVLYEEGNVQIKDVEVV